MSRQRRPLVRAIVLLALAIAFAASTATFNATYRQQAEVDAQLTNGADVTVTPAPGAAMAPDAAATLAAVPGVRAVEPIQHRFAYIGTDLQDLYGVRPATITAVTALQDTYFPGGTARAADGHPGGQTGLHPGLRRNRHRLPTAPRRPGERCGSSTPPPTNRDRSPFHYVGVVTEFPTAPKDSFFVANAGYVAAQTGTDAPGAFLVDTGGRDTAAVAARIRALVGTSAAVTDIATVRNSVGSSLTSVDLAGLTRIELSFALVLAVGAGALVLALGLAERRRSYALLIVLGARSWHLRAMVFSETGVLTVVGILSRRADRIGAVGDAGKGPYRGVRPTPGHRRHPVAIPRHRPHRDGGRLGRGQRGVRRGAAPPACSDRHPRPVTAAWSVPHEKIGFSALTQRQPPTLRG